MFGLVGVIGFRAFCAAGLPFFRLIQPSVAGQTKSGAVFRLVLATVAVVALALTRLCLVTSAFAGHAKGFVGGDIFNGFFAGRAILTKSGTFVAERANLTWNAVAQRIVIIDIIRIVRNERVGGTCFALEVV